jgi:hypothetical protein
LLAVLILAAEPYMLAPMRDHQRNIVVRDFVEPTVLAELFARRR